MRYAAKIDDNQPEIVRAFRSLGWSVAHAHTVGKGFPDLVIGRNGVTHLIEIKDGSKPKSARKLTPDQVEFHDAWRGSIAIVETVDDVVRNYSPAGRSVRHVGAVR